ncbi:MAG: hypothetical protein MUO31_07550 [Thermodesulfovibrionales bacterium]|nr:hypothetical protein [Thermodesulfovibrionales bacterium]
MSTKSKILGTRIETNPVTQKRECVVDYKISNNANVRVFYVPNGKWEETRFEDFNGNKIATICRVDDKFVIRDLYTLHSSECSTDSEDSTDTADTEDDDGESIGSQDTDYENDKFQTYDESDIELELAELLSYIDDLVE